MNLPMTDLLPYALLLVLAASWLAVMARLLVCLAAREPEIYGRLGRPVMRLLFWDIPAAARDTDRLPIAVRSDESENRARYKPEQLRHVTNLLEFIAGGRFQMLHDSECRRLGDALRTILMLFPLGLAALVMTTLRP
ncbi:MAG: hypothetical protein RLW61_03820 [Gammaproteobacteria bacterium]